MHAIAPFSDDDGEVKSAWGIWRIPYKITRSAVDGEDWGQIWVVKGSYGQATSASAWREVKRKRITIWIYGTRIVYEKPSHTAIVDGWKIEHRRTVDPQKRIDDELRFDVKRQIDGAGNVVDTADAVGIGYRYGVGACAWKGVCGEVDVANEVIAYKHPARALHGIDAGRVAVIE